MQGVGCRLWGTGCRIENAGCRVKGVGCRVRGLGVNRKVATATESPAGFGVSGHQDGSGFREIGMLLPNNQRQHRTL